MINDAHLISVNLAMQSRRMALAEAATNVVVGFVFAILVQALVFPLVGLKVTSGRTCSSAPPSPWRR